MKCSRLVDVYDAFFTHDFDKHFKKFAKRDPILEKRVREKIKEMQNSDPLRNSIELQGDFKGKRRVRIGEHRLIYEACCDCRGKGYEKFNRCVECKSRTDDSIVYFDILHRSSYEYDT